MTDLRQSRMALGAMIDWLTAERDAALARVVELERANSSGSPPAATPAATPQAAGVSTRELVARLAEAIGNYFEDGSIEPTDFVARLRPIIAAARRGGAE